MGNELSEGGEKARFGVEGGRSGVGPASRGVQRETEGKMESKVS